MYGICLRTGSITVETPVTILMVGIGGYGYYYLKTLLERIPSRQAVLRAVVDPLAKQSGHYPRLIEEGIPIFDEMEDFYQAGMDAALAVIASPIQFHVPQSCVALKHGTHVLCDKPIAPVVQEADLLIRTAADSGAWCGIGYQWSYSRAIRSLKQDIRKGLFGKPLRLKTLIFWPRDDAYYRRNNWAGKVRDESGRWVLDSPANNAMAHFLHNLYYILGEDAGAGAQPQDVVAELYRANPIENCDTAFCRSHAGGAELLFYASHATRTEQAPTFLMEFENAVVRFNEPEPEIVVQTGEGARWSYGSPEDDDQFQKLFDAIRAVHTMEPPVCGPAAARPQCVCANGMQDSADPIASFPPALLSRDEEHHRWWVEGLEYVVRECYRKDALPSEIGIPWAQRGRSVDLRCYNRYPGVKDAACSKPGD